MKTIQFRITGTRPLLMHADTLSNPLNPLTVAHKVLTKKAKKSEEDNIDIAKSDYSLSLYIDKELGPFIPGLNIEACLVAGGKLSKLGAQLKRSVEVMDEKCKLEYEGPRSVQGLWDKKFCDVRAVKVGTSRVMRYRPLFREWSATFEVMFDEDTIDQAQVVKCLEDGGAYCGVGDFRPKFGRFSVEVV